MIQQQAFPEQAVRRSPSPRMRVAAAIIGNALEFYDFTVYAAFATWLAKAFFPADNPTVGLLLAVATFGVGFVSRPLGGVVIGAYADRFGRMPAMTMTILLMAIGTGMIGILPTYAQIGVLAPVLLVCARLLQGFQPAARWGRQPLICWRALRYPENASSAAGNWRARTSAVLFPASSASCLPC